MKKKTELMRIGFNKGKNIKIKKIKPRAKRDNF